MAYIACAKNSEGYIVLRVKEKLPLIELRRSDHLESTMSVSETYALVIKKAKEIFGAQNMSLDEKLSEIRISKTDGKIVKFYQGLLALLKP